MAKHVTQIALAFDQSTFDVPNIALLEAAQPYIGLLKVGLESMTARDTNGVTVAFKAAEAFTLDQARVLQDWKLHDISNTVAAAVRNLAGTCGGITLHASMGPKGLEAAVKARYEKIGPRHGFSPDDPTPWTTLYGVTVLTSHDEEECKHIFYEQPRQRVLEFARDCMQAGIDGLVCSGQELEFLQDCGIAGHFTTLVPGGRPAWASTDDQKRVLTPREISRLGADFAVFGRPILKGPYPPLEAIRRINEEMAAG